MFIASWLTIEALFASVAIIASIWPIAHITRALIKDLREAGRSTLITLGVVLIVAAVLRLVIARPTLLVNPVDLHLFLSRLFDPLGPNASWHAANGVGGFLFFAGLAKVFGVNIWLVWIVNGVLGSLASLLLYLLTSRLTGNRKAGIAAAFLLAVFPPAIRVDASEQLATATIFFSLLAYNSVFEFARRTNLLNGLAAGVACGAALNMRVGGAAHVAMACLLYFVLAHERGTLRIGWAQLAGLAVILVLAMPRAIVFFLALTSETYTYMQFPPAILLKTFFSRLHIFTNPTMALPIYPLLCLVGLFFLARMKRRLLLAWFSLLLVGGSILFLNEWTLDINEALRFQYPIWFIEILLSGIGLSWLTASCRRKFMRLGLVISAAALAGSSLVPAWALLTRPSATDQDLRFFTSKLELVPAECNLLLFRPEQWGKRGYFGPGNWPDWLLADRGRHAAAYPKELNADLDGGCRVVFVGMSCYQWYPADTEGVEFGKRIYKIEHRPALYEILNDWKQKLEAKPPALMRSGCREVFRRFDAAPIATTMVEPGRSAWFWNPAVSVKIGFYRLEDDESNSRPAPDASGTKP